MTSVDQQKIRRTRTGLISHDPSLAQPGYTLFTPMYGDGTVYLIDMAGEIVHRWNLPYRPGLYGHLLDNGHLFYGGKVMEDLDRFEAWPRFKAGAALEIDWQGRIVWELRHPDHHHDARKLRNGNVLLLCLRHGLFRRWGRLGRLRLLRLRPVALRLLWVFLCLCGTHGQQQDNSGGKKAVHLHERVSSMAKSWCRDFAEE